MHRFLSNPLIRNPLTYSNQTKIIIVLSLLCLLTISGLFGNSGLFQAYRLRVARSKLETRVTALQQDRAHIARMLSSLERERAVQEVVIRDALGFVRDGELVFEFTD